MNNKSTIDLSEINKFSKMANEWWDPYGKLQTLHQINPVRLRYIKDKIENHFGSFKKDLSIIDIGCGGGLVSIPLARIGAEVTGIDASPENIEVAKLYASQQDLKINFLCDVAENHKDKYDVVLALEIIEHTADPELFINSIAKLIKPGGMIIISTINRTKKSYLTAILAAEYLLRWVEVGTHDYRKFIKPSELAGFLRSSNVIPKELKGLSYSILNQSWHISDDIDTNYFICATIY